MSKDFSLIVGSLMKLEPGGLDFRQGLRNALQKSFDDGVEVGLEKAEREWWIQQNEEIEKTSLTGTKKLMGNKNPWKNKNGSW